MGIMDAFGGSASAGAVSVKADESPIKPVVPDGYDLYKKFRADWVEKLKDARTLLFDVAHENPYVWVHLLVKATNTQDLYRTLTFEQRMQFVGWSAFLSQDATDWDLHPLAVDIIRNSPHCAKIMGLI